MVKSLLALTTSLHLFKRPPVASRLCQTHILSPLAILILLQQLAGCAGAAAGKADAQPTPVDNIETPAERERPLEVGEEQKDTEPSPDKAETARKQNPDTFFSYFSVGLLVSHFPNNDHKSITEAEVRNDTIVVDERTETSTELGLQAFYPLFDLNPDIRRTILEKNAYGRVTKATPWELSSQGSFGPYLGATFSTEDVLSTVSAGLAFRHEQVGLGFLAGFGFVIDTNAQRLSSDSPEGLMVTDMTVQSPQFERFERYGFQFMFGFTPGL